MIDIDATNPHPHVVVGQRISANSYSPRGFRADRDSGLVYYVYRGAEVINVHRCDLHGCVRLCVLEAGRRRGEYSYLCEDSADWVVDLEDGMLW